MDAWYKDPVCSHEITPDVGDDTTNTASVKFYQLSTQAIRVMVQADNSAFELPFDVSGEEREIIQHNGSALIILGRSGTGRSARNNN